MADGTKILMRSSRPNTMRSIEACIRAESCRCYSTFRIHARSGRGRGERERETRDLGRAARENCRRFERAGADGEDA